MNDQEKATIIEVLCGLALSDHLGDVRDEEVKLWELVGVPRSSIYNEEDDAWTNTRRTLARNGLDLPEYLEDSSDDEDED